MKSKLTTNTQKKLLVLNSFLGSVISNINQFCKLFLTRKVLLLIKSSSGVTLSNTSYENAINLINSITTQSF